MPKCCLEIFGDETGKGGLTWLAVTRDPCGASAPQRAAGAQQSTDQPDGSYIAAATAFGRLPGQMGQEDKKVDFFRKQCRGWHLSCLLSHPMSAGDILCGRNYAKNTEQRLPGKSFPLPRSLGPRAGATKSAPACFCTARGLGMDFPFF